MKKRLLTPGLILLLAILAAPFIRNFVRDVIVIPFLYLFWIGRFFVEAIPQQWLWTGFVGICLLVLGISLVGQQTRKSRKAPAVDNYEGRIEAWAKLFARAKQDDYFKWRLAQQLQKVALNALAHQKGQSIKQIRQQMRYGQLDMPPEIAAYFQASLKPLGQLPAPKRFYQIKTQPPSPLDLDPAHVVQYLEYLHQLSIVNSQL